MKSFKDSQGRSWDLGVNFTSVKRVRDLVEIDLLDLEGGKVFEQLIDDPMILCNVIYALVKPAIDKAGITDEEFGESMAGDAIEHATNALIEELVDFFPGPKRALLRKAMGKLRNIQTMIMETANREMEDPDFEKSIIGKLSTSLPGLSGSTPEN